MAPVRPKGTNKARKSATSGPSKLKSSSKVSRPPPKQVKTKSTSVTKPVKRKAPVYTDAQLGLPSLNSIIPASATLAQRKGKGTGKKKNKIYVDDKESMMTILAMVNAEKEGQIESKMIRERQMEEIREARKKEAEKRKEGKKGELEEVKKGLKRGGKKLSSVETGKRSGVDGKSQAGTGSQASANDGSSAKKKKRVSFAAT